MGEKISLEQDFEKILKEKKKRKKNKKNGEKKKKKNKKWRKNKSHCRKMLDSREQSRCMVHRM